MTNKSCCKDCYWAKNDGTTPKRCFDLPQIKLQISDDGERTVQSCTGLYTKEMQAKLQNSK